MIAEKTTNGDDLKGIIRIKAESLYDEQKLEILFGSNLKKGIINDLSLKDLEAIRDNLKKGIAKNLR